MPMRTIDCNYFDQPEVAAAYFVRDGDRVAFIDNNTALAVPRMLAALGDEGLGPADVEWIIVTHVHLDHAAGTSALAAACPDATVLCHPRAARHLVDPSKLVASAKHVYGEETFARLYGEILPVAAARVRSLEDGESVLLGARPLTFLHTRGHANHHFCILDAGERNVYTGDAFGLAYPRLQRAGLFMFPSSSPTDFDPVAARETIVRLRDSGAERAFPTHFGAVTDLPEAARQMTAMLNSYEAILDAAVASPLEGGALETFCVERMREVFARAAERRGLTLSPEDWEFLKIDVDLNGAGIAHVANKRRQPAARE